MALTALSSGKIYKYEYGTGEEILPSNQTRTIEKLCFHILLLKKLLKNKQRNKLML